MRNGRQYRHCKSAKNAYRCFLFIFKLLRTHLNEVCYIKHNKRIADYTKIAPPKPTTQLIHASALTNKWTATSAASKRALFFFFCTTQALAVISCAQWSYLRVYKLNYAAQIERQTRYLSLRRGQRAQTRSLCHYRCRCVTWQSENDKKYELARIEWSLLYWIVETAWAKQSIVGRK